MRFLGNVVVLMMMVIVVVVKAQGDETPNGATQAPTGVVENTPYKPLLLTYKIAQKLAHDTSSFTEGLLFREDTGTLLESKGNRGQSGVVEWSNGQKKTLTNIAEFGEGIALVGRDLIMLTYTSRIVHVFDIDTWNEKETHDFPQNIREGWGLCPSPDRTMLLWSDGSSVIHYVKRTPGKRSLDIVKNIIVHDCFHGIPHVIGLNELELVPSYVTHQFLHHHLRGSAPAWEELHQPYTNEPEEYIWANVIGTHCIAVIHPDTGSVHGWLNIQGISQEFQAFSRVANGIAYNPITDEVWVTGKDWSEMFHIEVSLAEETITQNWDVATACRTPWRNIFRTPPGYAELDCSKPENQT